MLKAEVMVRSQPGNRQDNELSRVLAQMPYLRAGSYLSVLCGQSYVAKSME